MSKWVPLFLLLFLAFGCINLTQSNEVVEISNQQGAFIGSPEAKVEMIEFLAYTCHYCKMFHETTMPKVIKEYVNTGKVRVRFVAIGPVEASKAALCAGDQGKFYEYMDALYERQLSLSIMTKEDYVSLARSLGLNEEEFSQCYDSEEVMQRVADDIALANQYGVTGTPTLIINGKKIVGAQPYDVIKEEIERALNAS